MGVEVPSDIIVVFLISFLNNVLRRGEDGWDPGILRPRSIRRRSSTARCESASLGFSELTIRALLGHGSQSVTQDYIHIDEALKLAATRTSDEIASLLDRTKRTKDAHVSRQAA